MTFLWQSSISHKVSILWLGKDEFTIKGNSELELRNAYLRFYGKGLSSSFTSSFGKADLGSSSFFKGSNLEVLWWGMYEVASKSCSLASRIMYGSIDLDLDNHVSLHQ